MDGYEVKRVMDQVHISAEMQEEVIMNVQDRMESGKNRVWNVRRMAATAAAFVLAAGVVSFPVRAVVSSVVKERMESVPREEMTGLNDMVQSQPVAADGFSREYSDSEKGRKKALWQAYENGTFPEGVITQVESPEEALEGKLCYIKATGVFNLPAQEMTDEEILQIIDFQHKMSYAVAQGPQAQEARAESQEKEDRLKMTLENAGGGISADQAVEIAREQMKAELGDKADELELLKYRDGSNAVSLMDVADYSEAEFACESRAGVMYHVHFDSPDAQYAYGFFIDAVDGSILYTYN